MKPGESENGFVSLHGPSAMGWCALRELRRSQGQGGGSGVTERAPVQRYSPRTPPPKLCRSESLSDFHARFGGSLAVSQRISRLSGKLVCFCHEGTLANKRPVAQLAQHNLPPDAVDQGVPRLRYLGHLRCWTTVALGPSVPSSRL